MLLDIFNQGVSHMKYLIGILFSLILSTTAQAQYSQEEMCDLIPRLYRGTPPLHVFFDAKDRGPLGITIRKTKFYSFSLEKEVPGGLIRLGHLGEIFKGFRNGNGYTTEQHGIYFDDGIQPDGRVLTKIFNFPRKTSPTSTSATWAIYKLCKQETCENPTAHLGEWQLQNDSIDLIRVNFADVFALYFSDSRTPPKLECLPGPFPHFEGPFERQ